MSTRIAPLPADVLRRRCDVQQLAFDTTADLEDLTEIVGQQRAVAAMNFGVSIRRPGYNLYALGPSGTGKHTTLKGFIQERAATQSAPADWCYVNNFEEPDKPRAIRLPLGRAVSLRRDVERLLEELRSAIPAAFESEDYRTRKQVIEEEIKERHQKAFEDVRRQAGGKEIALLRAPTGFIFAPLRKGEVLSHEEFEALPEAERRRIAAEMEALQEKLQDLLQQVPQWEREGRERVKALNREVTIFAVGHSIEEMRRKYAELAEVVAFFNAVQQDIIENANEFLASPEAPLAGLMGIPQSHLGKGAPFFRRYLVNVLVGQVHDGGSPVVYEDHPTFQNLVGEFEHISHLGALVTDFNLIRAGALHKANGGYLLLDAHKVLMQPYAWEALKRALRAGEVRVESLGQMLGLVSTVTLEPQPIALDIKVVLFGERLLYYLLCQYDPEFNELFKVEVDFEEDMERSPQAHQLYARLIATVARREALLPFDREAVASLIEESARAAGDAGKLSTHALTLADLLREADHWAAHAGRKTVTAADVARAIDAQRQRAGRIRERLQEAIQRGVVLIDTEGEKVGQVNGLSVIALNHHDFGHPSCITARVRIGTGEVIDIEREVELGGPIHSKGVLILSGLLGARYAPDIPLSLRASLVFEQSYAGVEGDSASVAELCALLSALAQVPLRQSLAVTGSVNQHGLVQAIGGVNEKIEGFFDVCQARGLNGHQGVLIPAANVRHLMLREEVVEAAAAGRFHIYAVDSIDEAMELLTGMPAGERDENGQYPEGTINHLVETRLVDLAQKRAAFSQLGGAESEGETQ